MSGINKAIIVGRVGKDPETSGVVTKFTVATSEKYKDKAGVEQEKTEWHTITTFGKLAEVCQKYVTKGMQVYVEGKIQTSSYEKDGVKKYSTSIIANTVQFLSKSTQATQQTDSNVIDSFEPKFDDQQIVPF